MRPFQIRSRKMAAHRAASIKADTERADRSLAECVTTDPTSVKAGRGLKKWAKKILNKQT